MRVWELGRTVEGLSRQAPVREGPGGVQPGGSPPLRPVPRGRPLRQRAPRLPRLSRRSPILFTSVAQKAGSSIFGLVMHYPLIIPPTNILEVTGIVYLCCCFEN